MEKFYKTTEDFFLPSRERSELVKLHPHRFGVIKRARSQLTKHRPQGVKHILADKCSAVLSQARTNATFVLLSVPSRHCYFCHCLHAPGPSGSACFGAATDARHVAISIQCYQSFNSTSFPLLLGGRAGA